MADVITHEGQTATRAATDVVRVQAAATPPGGTAPPGGRRGRRVRAPGQRGDLWTAFLFLSPTLVVFGVFILFPILFSFYLSFQEWNLFTSEHTFVGMANYRAVFADPEFWQVFGNTAVYTFATVPLNMVLALAVAFLLEQQIRGKRLLRAAFFTPVVVSSVAAAVIWRWVFDPNLGLVNTGLEAIGLPAVNWTTDGTAAMASLITVGVWKTFGINMVLFAAGLSAIPVHYYEAAAIDGASRWARFWNITLPLLAPTTLFVMVLSMIGSFQVFDLVFVLTRGGPLGSTNVLVHYLYEHAFKYFDMGYASAVAYLLFALLFALTLIQIRAFRNRGAQAV
jgi:multiple sugar transport system permease protein